MCKQPSSPGCFFSVEAAWSPLRNHRVKWLSCAFLIRNRLLSAVWLVSLIWQDYSLLKLTVLCRAGSQEGQTSMLSQPPARLCLTWRFGVIGIHCNRLCLISFIFSLLGLLLVLHHKAPLSPFFLMGIPNLWPYNQIHRWANQKRKSSVRVWSEVTNTSSLPTKQSWFRSMVQASLLIAPFYSQKCPGLAKLCGHPNVSGGDGQTGADAPSKQDGCYPPRQLLWIQCCHVFQSFRVANKSDFQINASLFFFAFSS